MIIGLVFILFSNVFAILIPPIVRESIDGVLLLLDEGKMPKYPNIIPHYFQSKSGIAILSGGLILLSAFLKGICMYFMRMTIIVMSRNIEFDLEHL